MRTASFSSVIFAILLVFAFGAVNLSAQANRRQGTVVEGHSFEGVLIGKSTVADVIRIFGEDYQTIEHSRYSIELNYKAAGLAFWTCQADPRREVFVVEMQAPYEATTSKGIKLGLSTINDVNRIYGELAENDYSDADREGILFYFDEDDGNEGESTTAALSVPARSGPSPEKVVRRMELIEKDGLRQCDSKFGIRMNK